MEVNVKDSWESGYKVSKIVRLKHTVECFKCKKEILTGSTAAFDQGNCICADCLKFSILPSQEGGEA
jgi:hypothetical protein